MCIFSPQIFLYSDLPPRSSQLNMLEEETVHTHLPPLSSKHHHCFTFRLCLQAQICCTPCSPRDSSTSTSELQRELNSVFFLVRLASSPVYPTIHPAVITRNPSIIQNSFVPPPCTQSHDSIFSLSLQSVPFTPFNLLVISKLLIGVPQKIMTPSICR